MAKTGRKRKNYVTSWGETIVGLGRLKNNRWVDLDDRKHPWTSRDEREAIREFRRRQARQRKDMVTLRTEQKSLDIANIQEALELSENL